MEQAVDSRLHANGRLNGASGARTKTPPHIRTARPSIDESDDDGHETSLFGRRDEDEDEEEDEEDPWYPEPESPLAVVSPVSVTSPPYWLNANPHQRAVSNMSAESILPPGGITLRDNETNGHNDDRNKACWAKSVAISGYVIVNSSATNIGAFVVWNIKVETLNGSYMNIRKRYSEFDELRRQLIATFPAFEGAVPALPPKSVISKFRPRFLEKRRAGLQYFLNCIMLNPEFSGSPILKDFLFS